MSGLSVMVVTFNEEHNIREALESVKWAGELIVVDSYSTDGTVEICREYTDKIILREWKGFIDQKNFALEQCQGEWILNLDADERVSAELKDSIERAISQPNGCSGFRLNRHTWYLGAWVNHCGWYPDYVLRLFRKESGRWSGYEPHAAVELKGKVGKLTGDLLHYSYRDISHHLRQIDSYSTSAAKAYGEKGRRCHWWDLVLRPPLVFVKKFILQQGFRDKAQGLIISLLSAYSVFCKYAKLWEASNGKTSQSISPRRAP